MTEDMPAKSESTTAASSQPAGNWLKRHFRTNPGTISFADLYNLESGQLDGPPQTDAEPKDPDRSARVQTQPAGEPWIASTPYDRLGLALSGGGIRSATFNIGVLQALARLGILEHVDYLSTVSGGGYAGAFWTGWLHRRKRGPKSACFPAGNDQRGGERAEIRHLREFSRFLLPRMGFFQTEFWGIVMTVLGGMLPSLLAALAVLGAAWYVWVVGLLALTLPSFHGDIVAAGGLLLFLGVTELVWRSARRADPSSVQTATYFGISFLSCGFIYFLVKWSAQKAIPDSWGLFSASANALSIPKVVATCAFSLLCLRVIVARFCRRNTLIPVVAGLERCATRMIGLSVGLFGLSGIWLLSGLLAAQGQSWRIQLTAGGTAVSAGAFVWAKKWLTRPIQQTRGDTFFAFARDWLKRATPKCLAAIVWLLLFILVGAWIHWWGAGADHVLSLKFWWPSFGCLGAIALVIFIFDPSRVGMHEFYRSRISRCYLGASNYPDKTLESERAAKNRQVVERSTDDLELGDLKNIDRPVHLVCVAANNMSGDPLGTLYRGARSAVLSGNGISLGDETAALDKLRFSSAITASAAAFNSQMGRVSMDLGPAVSFLMSALNLRLGLWVPHPTNRYRGSYHFPGRFFLAELFGISRTDRHNLHLSDGNHFENFGLYELVRRHCRYIIVSDCGADPTMAFDDLANVLRRVREDFGVEIELEIDALRPDENNRVKQHAVVGTIHYNGPAGMDKGTILFFKAALSGDEPPDVLQYGTRNRSFPHESTGDQFYDEAQWESYRRLGEHAVDSVLGFFEAPVNREVNVPDRLFRDARSRWAPAPLNQNLNFLEMSERSAALERDLMSDGPTRLRAEYFAEAVAISALSKKASGAEDTNKSVVSTEDPLATELKILGYLVRVVQIMEDTWLTADLDRYWSHPLNEGWMNNFRRWAATPSFRRWWPLIASLYGPGLREFVGKRFSVGMVDADSNDPAELKNQMALLHLRPDVPEPSDFFRDTLVGRQYLQTRPLPNLRHCRFFAYDLALLEYDATHDHRRLPVGFILIREELMDAARPDLGWCVKWNMDELFVFEALEGAGFVSKLLDSIIRFYRLPSGEAGKKFKEVHVLENELARAASGKHPSRSQQSGQAARYERVKEIDFYKSRGFGYTQVGDPHTLRLVL